jgi:N-acyl-D-aspartate/D-glutamate deacylase
MLDILIRGGTVLDGTGGKPFPGDVGISGDRIAEMGNLAEASAAQVVDARGLAVAPGFIDIHSHHDLYLVDQDPMSIFESFIRQGVTTSVVGNCGWTLAPCLPETKHMVLEQVSSIGVFVERFHWTTMAEFLSHIESQGLPCNIAQLVGHGAIRLSVMGDENRFCTAEELERMKNLVRESMEAGCVGLSTGLMYYPGMYAHTDELIALAKVAGEYGGRYASHLRGYFSTLKHSLTEAIIIAEKAAVPLQVSHLHAVPFLDRLANPAYYVIKFLDAINSVVPLPPGPNPALAQGLEAIQKALDRGLDVGADVIPYTLGNTTATILFPPWANKGGLGQLLERLKDTAARRRMERDIRTLSPKWPHWEEDSWSDPFIKAMGWKPIRVLSVKSDENRWAEGMSFPEIGRRWGVDPFSALCRLTLEEEGRVTFTWGYPGSLWIEKMFNELIRHPQLSIGADAILPQFGTPPPSAYGCFPRVLGHYAREFRLFPLETAVHKMTGLSARRFALKGRGELKKGAFADIAVFEPSTVNDNFTEGGRPTFAKGISHVFVNGSPMLWDGELRRDLRPGRVLRRM